MEEVASHFKESCVPAGKNNTSLIDEVAPHGKDEGTTQANIKEEQSMNFSDESSDDKSN